MFSERYIKLFITSIISAIKSLDYTSDNETYFYTKGLAIAHQKIIIDPVDMEMDVFLIIMLASIDVTISTIGDPDILNDVMLMTNKLDKLNKKKLINKTLVKTITFSMN